MKACTIYKTSKKEYKIVSQCETDLGYLLDVAPVYILSIESSNEDLVSAILDALNSSAKIVKAPARSEFPLIQSSLLSQLREKSFSNLYKKSSSCSIRVEKNIMRMYPNRLVTKVRPQDGLFWVEEDKVVVEDYFLNVDALMLKIREILNHKY